MSRRAGTGAVYGGVPYSDINLAGGELMRCRGSAAFAAAPAGRPAPLWHPRRGPK